MVNIGVIGAGYWGKNLVRVFSELESVRLRYVADHSADVRESIGKRHPSTVLLDDHHPIIDDPAIDAGGDRISRGAPSRARERGDPGGEACIR